MLSEHHRAIGRQIESSTELRHVGQSAVNPEALDRMRVIRRLVDLIVRSRLRRPQLTERDEESLFVGEAVLVRRTTVLLDRQLQCAIGDTQTHEVRDRFTAHEFTLHMNSFFAVRSRNDHEALEEIFDLLHEPLEVGIILRSPPLGEVALQVVQAAFVIEVVPVLVTDHRSDGAQNEGDISEHVEKRRLEDSRRIERHVFRLTALGIHRLRCHAPLVQVDVAANLVQIATGAELRDVEHVPQVRRTIDLQSRVVTPLVRIADVANEGFQLLDGVVLRCRRHPLHLAEHQLHRSLLELVQLQHASFGFRRELIRDVELPDSFAERAADHAGDALPAFLLHLRAHHHFAVEFKAVIDESLRQKRRHAGHQMVPEIRTQRPHRLIRQDLAEPLEESHLTHVDGLELRGAELLEIVRHVDGRAERLELRDGHLVAALLRIAQLLVGHGDVRQSRLQAENSLSMASSDGTLFSEQREETFDVLQILRALFGRVLIRLQIEVTIFAGAALHRMGHQLVAVVRVLGSAETEEGIGVEEVQACHHIDQVMHGADASDPREFRLKSRETLGFDAGFVHAGEVEVADLLSIAARLGFRGGESVEETDKVLQRFVAQLHEHAPARVFRRDFGVLEPRAVAVNVEIDARIDSQIHVLDLNAMRDRREKRFFGSHDVIPFVDEFSRELVSSGLVSWLCEQPLSDRMEFSALDCGVALLSLLSRRCRYWLIPGQSCVRAGRS
jgi:hypothetical protein